MLEDMFLFTDIYIRYKDITIFVVWSDDAEIISLETEYKITKSGINHHFRKINALVANHHK